MSRDSDSPSEPPPLPKKLFEDIDIYTTPDTSPNDPGDQNPKSVNVWKAVASLLGGVTAFLVGRLFGLLGIAVLAIAFFMMVAARKLGRLPQELGPAFMMLSGHLLWFLTSVIVITVMQGGAMFDTAIAAAGADIAVLIVLLGLMTVFPSGIVLGLTTVYELLGLAVNLFIAMPEAAGNPTISMFLVVHIVLRSATILAIWIGYFIWLRRLRSESQAVAATAGSSSVVTADPFNPNDEEVIDAVVVDEGIGYPGMGSVPRQSSMPTSSSHGDYGTSRNRPISTDPNASRRTTENVSGVIAIIVAMAQLLVCSIYCVFAIDWGGAGRKPVWVQNYETFSNGAVLIGTILLIPMIFHIVSLRNMTPKEERTGSIPSYIPAVLMSILALGLTVTGRMYPDIHQAALRAERRLSSEEVAQREEAKRVANEAPITADTPRTEADPIYQPDGSLLLTTDYTRQAADQWEKEFVKPRVVQHEKFQVKLVEDDRYIVYNETEFMIPIEGVRGDELKFQYKTGPTRRIAARAESVQASPSGRWIYGLVPTLAGNGSYTLLQIDSKTFKVMKSVPGMNSRIVMTSEGVLVSRCINIPYGDGRLRYNAFLLLDYDSLERIGDPISAQNVASVVSAPNLPYAYTVDDGKLYVYDLKVGRMIHLFDMKARFSGLFADRLEPGSSFGELVMIGNGKGLTLLPEERTQDRAVPVVRIEGENVHWIGTLPAPPHAYVNTKMTALTDSPLIQEESYPRRRRSGFGDAVLITSQGRTPWEYNLERGRRFFSLDNLKEPVRELEGILPQESWALHIDWKNDLMFTLIDEAPDPTSILIQSLDGEEVVRIPVTASINGNQAMLSRLPDPDRNRFLLQLDHRPIRPLGLLYVISLPDAETLKQSAAEGDDDI